eukprot:5521137-Pyramimonas_sp.AAC.1
MGNKKGTIIEATGTGTLRPRQFGGLSKQRPVFFVHSNTGGGPPSAAGLTGIQVSHGAQRVVRRASAAKLAVRAEKVARTSRQRGFSQELS